MSKVFKVILAVLLIFVLIIGGYAIYLFGSYHRIEDNQEIDVLSADINETILSAGDSSEYEVTSWNIGFAAYTDQYSFFMDGGKYSRAFSKEAVLENMENISTELIGFDSDFYLIQEVDVDATRSYHVNQKDILFSKLIEESSSSQNTTFAVNYDSPYLFYPFIKPHGKSYAGLMTFSDYVITGALRRSLPIQTDLAKLLDLDRCYVINRIPTDNGKELILINFHLSAYTTDPSIANQQLETLYSDIILEYERGNYVICGGDFNKDILGDSSSYFGVSGEDYSWAQSFPFDSIPEGFNLIAPIDEENPVPSCRNADAPWDPETNFQITIDGFIVSDNVNVVFSQVVDTQFKYSDHNPVQMSFNLK